MATKRSFGGLLVVAILVLGIAAGGYYFWKQKAAKPPEVVTTQITRGDIVQVVTSTGDLQPVVTTDVSSQISGQIKEVMVDFNSPVKKGDILARLDPATYDSRLKQAEAQLANTRANYTLVKLNYERIKSLIERQLVSQQELDQAEAQFQQASAQLLIQNAAVDNAKTDLSRCTLYAPLDGIVIDRIAEVGKTVAASLNAPTLFTIVNDLSRMQINASVAEADVGNIEVGQDVTFSVDAFQGRQFRGRVAQIRNSPKTLQNVVTYATIIDVRNEDLKLKPGMTANVSIITARRPNAVRIPNSALRARIPEEFLPKAPDPKPAAGAPAGAPGAEVAAAPAPAAPATPEARREQMRKLMADAGVDFRSGPPAPEALARVQALAKERGIELPERFGGGNRGGTNAVASRTVYKLAGGTPLEPKLEAATVRLGITDGIATEVISGLEENDVVVTSITIPGAPLAGPAGAQQGGTRNPFGGGATGGGGRRF